MSTNMVWCENSSHPRNAHPLVANKRYATADASATDPVECHYPHLAVGDPWGTTPVKPEGYYHQSLDGTE
jgi:hypothetical protein